MKPATDVRTRLCLRFENMSVADVPLVAETERRNYEFPWSERIFSDCLKAGYHCIVVRCEFEMIGYGILQVVADEGHVLNLCIDRAWQRGGHGRALLEHLLAVATLHGAKSVFLEVRPSNPRAMRLYERAGFNEIGIRRDYYDARDGREDACVMAIDLSHTRPRRN